MTSLNTLLKVKSPVDARNQPVLCRVMKAILASEDVVELGNFNRDARLTRRSPP